MGNYRTSKSSWMRAYGEGHVFAKCLVMFSNSISTSLLIEPIYSYVRLPSQFGLSDPNKGRAFLTQKISRGEQKSKVYTTSTGTATATTPPHSYLSKYTCMDMCAYLRLFPAGFKIECKLLPLFFFLKNFSTHSCCMLLLLPCTTKHGSLLVVLWLSYAIPDRLS